MLAAMRCTHTPPAEELGLEKRNAALLRRASESETEVRRLERLIAEEKLEQSPPSLNAEPLPRLPKQVLRPMAAPSVQEEEAEGGNEASSQVLATSQYEEMTWYHQGLQLLEMKKEDAAIRAFSEFLRRAPGHVYADRAKFWIGEAYFRSGEFALALTSDNQFLAEYPTSFKAAEVMYRTARAYLRLNQTRNAKTLLREVLREYPESPLNKAVTRTLVEISRNNQG
jgi:tol-pal system protein YbgF